MEIQNLPMFKELSRVFCSYNIESWQTVDFWDKVKLLKVVDSNVNYQSVYRLILRLVKDGYLTIDVEKVDMDKPLIPKQKICMIYDHSFVLSQHLPSKN